VADGGWEDVRTAERLARFCERAVDHLGDLIGLACTINEPNVVAWVGYLFGEFPPGRQDMAAFRRANDVMLRACRLAHAALKGGRGDFPVGVTLSMHDYDALPGGEVHVDEARSMLEDEFLEGARGDDFLGVQCYTRLRFGPDGMVGPADGVPTTIMGYEYWPRCVEVAVRRAAEVTGGIPVYVTENGIATTDDRQRIAYVSEALAGVRRCLDDGVDVRGYLYWSAFDNFEWARGYGPTFGLVAVDRTTFVRTPKPSAKWLGEVARTGHLPAP
jgi:beta-glucosidase